MFIDFKPLSSYIHNLSYLQIIKTGPTDICIETWKEYHSGLPSPHYEPDHRARVACGVDLGWYCAQQSACTQGDSFEGPGWKNIGNNKEKPPWTSWYPTSSGQFFHFQSYLAPLIVGGAPRSPLDKWRCWCRPTWSHLSLNWTPPPNQLISMVNYENYFQLKYR